MVLIVATVTLSMMSCGAARERLMNFRKLEYLAVAAPMMTPQTLSITADGRAQYVSHTNRDGLDRPEMGLFETNLPADQVESLRAALAKPPFRDWADHDGRVNAGDAWRRVQVTEASDVIMKQVGTFEPVPPPLDAFLDRMTQIVRRLAEHPVRVLRLNLQRARIQTKDELEVTFSLENAGTQPFFCRNPRDLVGAAAGKLLVELSPDKPNSELKAEDLFSVELTQVERVPPTEGVRSEGNWLELPPGGTAKFVARGRAKARGAGVYLAEMKYFSPLETSSDGKPLLYGDLLSLTKKVEEAAPASTIR